MPCREPLIWADVTRMECIAELISVVEHASMLAKYCCRTSGCGLATESGSTDTLNAGPSRLEAGSVRPLHHGINLSVMLYPQHALHGPPPPPPRHESAPCDMYSMEHHLSGNVAAQDKLSMLLIVILHD